MLKLTLKRNSVVVVFFFFCFFLFFVFCFLGGFFCVFIFIFLFFYYFFLHANFGYRLNSIMQNVNSNAKCVFERSKCDRVSLASARITFS